MKELIKKNIFDLPMIIFVCFMILIIFANIMLFLQFVKNKQSLQENYINELNNEIVIALSVYSEMADLVYCSHINNEEVKSIFAKGIAADSQAEKDYFRKTLYEKVQPLYEKLEKYKFRQLHFHEKDNKSFLRFHRPSKYGDDLTNIRDSVAYVNKNHAYISGFEEGRIFNGYRYVYPLEYENQHVGSVEVSVSIGTVISQLQEKFKKESQFILLKKQVDKKVFQTESSNYIPWELDDRFVLDKALSQQCILNSNISEEAQLSIQSSITENLLQSIPFNVELSIEGKSSLLTFIPIQNFKKKTVAYIIALSDQEEIKSQERAFVFTSGALLLLMLFLIVFVFYYKISRKKIEAMAIYDYLTKTYSRATIFKEIKNEHERYSRYKRIFALIMTDIDFFKKVNDTYGHTVGDMVLAKVANIIMTETRNSDSVGRYGGEEFIVLLPETSKENAASVAERIRAKIEAYEFENIDSVTISCGVSASDKVDETIKEIIDEADKNLYEAKETGRNKVIS